MFGKLKTFWNFPRSHKSILLKLALLLPLVEASVRIFKFKQTFSFLSLLAANKHKNPDNQLKIVRRYANYLNLFHQRFPFAGNCLARSLTLWFLLKRCGIETDLRFGMKKENGKLAAHAWLDFDGEALMSESEKKENYIPFGESIFSKVSR